LAPAARLRSAPVPPTSSIPYHCPALQRDSDVLDDSVGGRGRLNPGDPGGGFCCRPGLRSRPRCWSRVCYLRRLGVPVTAPRALPRKALRLLTGFCLPTGLLLFLSATAFPSLLLLLLYPPLSFRGGAFFFVVEGAIVPPFTPAFLSSGRERGAGMGWDLKGPDPSLSSPFFLG